MLKKLTNKKGFTLMEMLIVVAIIAVLVAIAIPTFNGALTKAKESADVANVRATYADCQIDMLTNGVAAPSDKNAFTTKIGVTLNYPDKLEYTLDGTTKVATITYKASVITLNNDGTTKNFTWTLNPLDIK